MRIDLVELKQIIDRLFIHITETRGVKYCELEKELYWNIPDYELYEIDDPKELDMGSLADDWEFLSELLNLKNQPIAYQLTQLAPILRYIGEKLGKDLAQYGG